MSRKTWSILIALGLLALSSTAMAAGKGTSILALELGQSTVTVSETVDPADTPGYLSLNQGPEVNFGLEFFHYLSEDWAINFSGGIGAGSYKEEPNDAADPELKITTKSYRGRLGVDRMGSVGERLVLFGGPGVEFVSATAKFEATPTTPAVEEESSSADYFGISGRIGLMVNLSDSVLMVGRVGHSLGTVSSSAERGNAKSSAWTNSFDAAWGLAISFGGK